MSAPPPPAKVEPPKGGRAAKAEAKAPPPPPPPPATPVQVLHRNLCAIDKFVETRDRLYLVRALRFSNFVRRHCPAAPLRKAIETFVADAARRAVLLELLALADEGRVKVVATAAADMDVENGSGAVAAAAAASSPVAAATASTATAPAAAPAASSATAAASPSAPAALRLPKPGGPSAPELEAFLTLLVLTMLQHQQQQRGAAAPAASLPASASAAVGDGASRLLELCAASNRRTLDVFQARAYALLAHAHESAGSLSALRPMLVAAHRTACLRHDEYGQAVLLNLLLRSYLGGGGLEVEVEVAQSLVSKASFPEGASNSQLVRFLLYSGRIHAVQLRYSEAYKSLLQAVRKAPTAAVGFRVAAQKLAIVVQLLMGEIPERALFAAPDLWRALAPYLALARAVRRGDLVVFGQMQAEHAATFAADGVASLVRRLEANVIKTGLRRIATSYSRISFAAVAQRLNRGSAEDAEFLCAQAVRDGVIDAVLDHASGTLESRATPNVYTGKEPQEAFQRRIDFCLQVHDEATRAMRYPPHVSTAADLEGAEARRDREREEAEFRDALDEGGGEDEDGDDDM